MAFKFGQALKLKQRIRYIEQGNKLIAQVEQRKGFRWLPTNVREIVDLDVAAKAMQVYDKRNGNTAGDDTAGFGDRLKRFAKRVAKSKVVKVIKKAHVAPLKIAHKITHGKNSPIRKAELALQKFVGKNLPIAKPFIDVHNKLAGATHKAVEKVTGGKSAKQALKAGGKALKPKPGDLRALAAAGAAAGGGKLAARAGKPTAQELAALAEVKRKVTATGISKALKAVPTAQRAVVRDELIRKATNWFIKSPLTGISYEFTDAQVRAASR